MQLENKNARLSTLVAATLAFGRHIEEMTDIIDESGGTEGAQPSRRLS
jgi:hypothetical protein